MSDNATPLFRCILPKSGKNGITAPFRCNIQGCSGVLNTATAKEVKY
jgi:hypothetical protein